MPNAAPADISSEIEKLRNATLSIQPFSTSLAIADILEKIIGILANGGGGGPNRGGIHLTVT